MKAYRVTYTITVVETITADSYESDGAESAEDVRQLEQGWIDERMTDLTEIVAQASDVRTVVTVEEVAS